MDADLKAAIDAVPERYRKNVTWGSRTLDYGWGARVGHVRELGHASAADAVRAATARLPQNGDCSVHPGIDSNVCPCRDYDVP